MYEGIVFKDISKIERELGLRHDCKIIGVQIVDGNVEFRIISNTKYNDMVELNGSNAPFKQRILAKEEC